MILTIIIAIIAFVAAAFAMAVFAASRVSDQPDVAQPQRDERGRFVSARK